MDQTPRRTLDDPLMAEACRIYGFKALVNPATLSTRQMELLDDIASALAQRDATIHKLRALCRDSNIDTSLIR